MASFVEAFKEWPVTCEVDGCVLTFETGCRYDFQVCCPLFLEFLAEVRALADAVTFFLLSGLSILALGMMIIKNCYQ